MPSYSLTKFPRVLPWSLLPEPYKKSTLPEHCSASETSITASNGLPVAQVTDWGGNGVPKLGVQQEVTSPTPQVIGKVPGPGPPVPPPPPPPPPGLVVELIAEFISNMHVPGVGPYSSTSAKEPG